MNRSLAACHGTGDLMFPGSSDPWGIRRAKCLCRPCPIRLECLAGALDRNEMFGVWGGMTVKERRRLRRQHPHVQDWGRLLGVVDLAA